jgi:YbbR domain-containing protein
MQNVFRRLSKYFPTLLLAFIMACAVWISAVTAADPNEENVYPNPVTITIIGLDPGLVMTNKPQATGTITLIAPHSIWNLLTKESGTVSALIDLSGLKAGSHNVRVQVKVDPRMKPVEVVGSDPATVSVSLETLATRTMPISLVVSGSPSVGFEVGIPALSQDYVSVSGPESLVQEIYRMSATINAAQVQADIHQTVAIQPLDVNDDLINGLTITPAQVSVTLPVTQLGGYRNVVVKVVVKGEGQVSSGYRVTNISVFPPVVTVFSSDPKIVDALPGYIETLPIDLTGAHNDIDTQVSLNLPDGVTIVGSQTVNVQVGVAAIEGSITLTNMPVQIINLGPNLAGTASPDKVDVILSGPLQLLDALTANQVHVTADMTGKTPGDYQIILIVTVDIPTILVESKLPGTVQVTVIDATPTPLPTPRGTATVTVKIVPTSTPKP